MKIAITCDQETFERIMAKYSTGSLFDPVRVMNEKTNSGRSTCKHNDTSVETAEKAQTVLKVVLVAEEIIPPLLFELFSLKY